MKFAYVAAEKARGEFKATELCSAFRLSTSGFYAWCKREPSMRSKKDEQLKVLIQASFDASRKTYGSPRVLEDLRDDRKEKVGRNRVIRLMQEQGLRDRARNRFKNTTMSEHDQPIAPTIKAELGETFESIHRCKEQRSTTSRSSTNQRRRHSTLDYVSPARYEREHVTEVQMAA